jgi:hypothetical protein
MIDALAHHFAASAIMRVEKGSQLANTCEKTGSSMSSFFLHDMSPRRREERPIIGAKIDASFVLTRGFTARSWWDREVS